jgi:hypothetical protein
MKHRDDLLTSVIWWSAAVFRPRFPQFLFSETPSPQKALLTVASRLWSARHYPPPIQVLTMLQQPSWFPFSELKEFFVAKQL